MSVHGNVRLSRGDGSVQILEISIGAEIDFEIDPRSFEKSQERLSEPRKILEWFLLNYGLWA